MITAQRHRSSGFGGHVQLVNSLAPVSEVDVHKILSGESGLVYVSPDAREFFIEPKYTPAAGDTYTLDGREISVDVKAITTHRKGTISVRKISSEYHIESQTDDGVSVQERMENIVRVTQKAYTCPSNWARCMRFCARR